MRADQGGSATIRRFLTARPRIFASLDSNPDAQPDQRHSAACAEEIANGD
jgi:hypothetical protein